jgi:hypothetical protein
LPKINQIFTLQTALEGLILQGRAGLPFVGNTYLYLQTLPFIFPLLKGGFWVENHHRQLLQSVRIAQDVGETILEFMENSQPALWKCLDEYGALRKIIRKKKNDLNLRKKEFQDRWIEQNRANIDKIRSQIVGSKRFALSNFIYKDRVSLDLSLETQASQLTEIYHKICPSNVHAVGAVVLSPAIIASAFALGQFFPKFFEDNSLEGNVEHARRLLFDRSILSLSQIETGDVSAQLHDLVVEVSKKTLHSDHTSKWAVELMYCKSSPQENVSDIFSCRINVKRQTIYFPEGSVIQKEDLTKIPSPCEHPDYSSAVNKIFDNHLLFEKSRSRMVLPLNGKQEIPLLFPDNYIAYWERKIGLIDLPVGFFVPFYEIREVESIWKLSLVFSFVKNKENPQKCARVVCSQFDKTTVDAFGGNLNELLVQAFSGSEYQLGLPDKDTYRLKNGTVAPHETHFPGLFAIMQKKPSRALFFNSTIYDKGISQALEKMVKGEAIDSKLENWVVKADWEPCEGYFKFATLLRQKEDLRDIEIKSYTKAYETLLGWCGLASSLSQKELQILIWEKLSLAPPAVVLASPPILPIDFMGFQSKIEEYPSKYITQMREGLEKVDSFLSKLNSHRLEEILNDMAEDIP